MDDQNLQFDSQHLGALPARRREASGQSSIGAAAVSMPSPAVPTPVDIGRVSVPASSGLDSEGVLAAFRRRWWLALGVGLLSGLAAMTAAWKFIPPAKYISRATLQVKSYIPKIIFDTLEQRATSGAYKQTQVALLRSRLILEDALNKKAVNGLNSVQGRLRVGEDPVEWLEKDLSITYIANSDILEVSLTGYVPDELPVLINAVVDSYMTQIVEKDHRARLERLEELRRLWGRYQAELKAKRKSLRELAESAGGSDQNALAMRQQYAAENLALAQRERIEVSSEIMKLTSELKVLHAELAAVTAKPPVNMKPGRPSTPSPSGAVATDPNPDTRKIRERIATLDSRVVAASRIAKKQTDPSVTLPARERDALKRELSLRLAAGEGRGGSSNDPTAVVMRRLEVLRVYDKALSDDIDRLTRDSEAAAVSTLDVQTEQDEVTLAATTAQRVGTEIEALEVELGAPRRIEVVDRAKKPVTKDDSKRLKTSGMAGVVAFALVLAGVTLLEYRMRRVGSEQDLERGIGIRVVGTVPAIPDRGPRRRANAQANEENEPWRSPLVESVDSIRTTLLHSSRTQGVRVVMVTSAVKGEGKTALCTQLAASLARAGLRILLIDSDLRRSALHRVFDVPADGGFCEVLRGDASLESVTHRLTLMDNLSLVTAGSCDATALRLLAQDGARQVFDMALKDYDYVIVDSAPVLPLVDARLMSQQVDAVVFSIMWDVSRVPQVLAARQVLAELDVKILGAVVNGMPRTGRNSPGYYYGYE